MGVSHIGLADSDRALGHENNLALGQTVLAIAPSATKRTRKVLIQALDLDVVWRDDGGDPSPTLGQVIFAGDTLVYTGAYQSMLNLKARTVAGAGTANVRVAYYGEGA